MYENFNAPSTESLDSIFNRLQKIVSQLAILDENISQEDFNMNTNEIDTANIQVSTVSAPVSTVNTHDNTANLSDATVYAFLANQPNRSQLVHEDLEQIHEDDLEEIDLKWQLARLSIRARRYFQKTGKKITINGSDTARSPRNQESRPRNQYISRKIVIMEDTSSKAMVAIDDAEFNKYEFDLATYKRGLASVEEQLVFYKNMSKTGLGFTSYNVVAPPPTGLFAPPSIDLSNSGLEEFQHLEFKGYGPKDSKSGFAPTAVLTKSGIVPISTARQSSSKVAAPVSVAKPINTAASKPPVNITQPRQNALQTSHLLSRRPFYQQTALKNKNLNNNVNTAKGAPQDALKDQGYFDNECSRHMTGNISYSLTLRSMMKGMLPLGEELKVVRLLAKEIRPGKLDFEDVYFVKELQFNLFSVSHICDKKNSVLFTDTECFVLSPNFKLADESQVLLKVPRKNNMYSFDMKNIVSQKDLTCLLAKAINDESMLWHRRLATKDETNRIFKSFITEIENLVEKKVKIIRCDNGTEFKNRVMNEFCEEKGITKEFSVARTPQQNRVAERRNMTLIEAARTMLADSKLPTTFWAEAVNIACYVKNKLGKFDRKSDEWIFVGYFTTSKAFRVYNIRTKKVEENLHITLLENKPMIAGTNSNHFAGKEASFDADGHNKDKHGPSQASESDNQKRPNAKSSTKTVNTVGTVNTATPTYADYPNDPLISNLEDVGIFDDAYDDRDEGAEADYNNLETVILVSPIPFTRIHKDHPKEHIIGEINSALQTRKMAKQNQAGFISFINKQRRTNHKISKIVYLLVFSLTWNQRRKRAIGTKWVYRNKRDQKGIIVRNKSRLVAQRHRQEEGIDYDEVFAHVARIEAIRLFLAYESFMDFTVYQMNVKSAFLYGTIEEKVYVSQPPGFVDPEFSDRVYKMEKALYGLHQALRACVKSASTPMETYNPLSNDAAGTDVDVHLYRSMIGSMMYLTSSSPDIMFVVCACSRFQVQPKVSHMHAVKRIFKYLKGQPTLGLWYPKDSPLELIAYSVNDYVGASLDRKSTTGGNIQYKNIYTNTHTKQPNPSFPQKGQKEIKSIIPGRSIEVFPGRIPNEAAIES
nr:hypothetical protein [Tanacetum cinerariifolium]